MMSETYQVGPAGDEAELLRLLEILAPIFHFPAERAPKFRDAMGDENFRVVRRGAELAGGLGVVLMGQFFGGRRVSMGGIAAVGISPAFRARGAASALMADVLREMHREKSCAISTLYPATVPVYRKAGYELAGCGFEINLPTSQIDVREYGPTVRPIGSDDDRELVERMYREHAQRHNGPLDRGPYIWNRVREFRGEKAHGYIVEDAGRPAGYIYYLIKDGPDGWEGHHLLVSDIVALTPPAARRLLTLLGDHRSMEHYARWFGSASPGFLAPLREVAHKAKLHETWMVRIVDVERALKERGYAPGIDAEAHLEVRDDLIEANNGRFVLTVGRGEASVSRGGRGDVKLHVRGLAALFTGFRTVEELVLMDLAEAGGAAATITNAVFAGPAPWLGDTF